jgi:hypothetical protein
LKLLAPSRSMVHSWQAQEGPYAAVVLISRFDEFMMLIHGISACSRGLLSIVSRSGDLAVFRTRNDVWQAYVAAAGLKPAGLGPSAVVRVGSCRELGATGWRSVWGGSQTISLVQGKLTVKQHLELQQEFLFS